MPETPGALMRRLKREVANPDDRVEGEQVTKFFWLPAETMALAHSAPTGTGRGPVYYAMPTWSVTNLLSWWTLAEIEAARDIHDGYNGTVNGNPVYTQGVDLDIDRVRRFLRFDGTGDDVDVGDITELDGAATVTWACRFRVSSLATLRALIGRSVAVNEQFSIEVDTSGRVYAFLNGGIRGYTVAGTIALNTWYTLVVVFNGAGATNPDKQQIYVNGVPKTLTFASAPPATLATVTGDVYIGQRGDGSQRLVGDEYDTAIWLTNLSAAQALAYHNDASTDRIVAGFFKAS